MPSRPTPLRAAPALLVALGLAAPGCGGDGGDGQRPAARDAPAGSTTQARARPPRCTRAAFATRLTTTGTPARVKRHRCARGWAVTTLQAGDQQVRMLWRSDRKGRWQQRARAAAPICPGRSTLPAGVARRLCGPPDPAAQAAVRACTPEAFAHALHADVDQLRVTLADLQCSGERAATGFTFGDCAPGGDDRRACEQPRVAYWRLASDRWRLITYTENRSCVLVQTIDPGFPAGLCGG